MESSVKLLLSALLIITPLCSHSWAAPDLVVEPVQMGYSCVGPATMGLNFIVKVRNAGNATAISPSP
jgi:hypothetical protein